MPRYWRALLAAAIAIELAQLANAQRYPSVAWVVDARIIVRGGGGEGLLPIAVSQDWSHPLPQVSRAVIVVHGMNGNAADYYQIGTRLAPDGGTLIIAPQFLLEQDAASQSLPANVLRWRGRWQSGDDAAGPVAVSSYDAIDVMFATLADCSRFPNLRMIVLAGFSRGGQLVQRYAVFGRGADAAAKAGIVIRYVVGSPSSYVYFTADRPVPGDGFAAFAGASACPNFNRWQDGLEGALPRYVAAAGSDAATLERRYAGLNLIYLLGTADNDPYHASLDKSCAAEAEGPDRYDRGVNFFHYMQARDAAVLKQRLWAAPGAGHDAASVFGSPCGRAALFDQPGCVQQ
jgi:hypothetical protein